MIGCVYLKKIYDFYTSRNMSHSYNTRFRIKHQNSTSNAKKKDYDGTTRVLRSDTRLKQRTYKLLCLVVDMYEHVIQVGLITSAYAIEILHERKYDIDNFDHLVENKSKTFFIDLQARILDCIQTGLNHPRFAYACKEIYENTIVNI